MIKLTTTDGLAYVLPPSEVLWPARDDDEAAFQKWPEVRQKVKEVISRFKDGYHPNYQEAFLEALAGIPGVASVEDLDPQPPEKDPAPEVDKKGDPIIY